MDGSIVRRCLVVKPTFLCLDRHANDRTDGYFHTSDMFIDGRQCGLRHGRTKCATALLLSESSNGRDRYELIYIYIHTYIHTYIHMYIHTYIHTYIHMYIHTYIHTYIHIILFYICVGCVYARSSPCHVSQCYVSIPPIHVILTSATILVLFDAFRYLRLVQLDRPMTRNFMT